MPSWKPAEKIVSGFQFTEGPVWHADGYLLFSDIPADAIMRWDEKKGVTVWRKPSGQSNGLAWDREGRLLAAEHGNRRLSRTRAGGTSETLLGAFEGKKLNSPNDLAVHSSGAVFFTDPDYGLAGRVKEQPCNGVYCVARDGSARRLLTQYQQPNGLVFSPDEKTLYVGDSKANLINAYDVTADLNLTNERRFADVEAPDGMKVDRAGRLYVAAKSGVAVFAPNGASLGVIAVPEQPTNCAIGGADGKTLFITARTSLFRARIMN